MQNRITKNDICTLASETISKLNILPKISSGADTRKYTHIVHIVLFCFQIAPAIDLQICFFNGFALFTLA